MKKPFIKKWNPKWSDGCTLFPQGDWRPCCVLHDKKYYYGGNRKQKFKADVQLMKGIAKRGHPIMGCIAFIGVTLFGGPYWPHQHRWNNGHKYSKSFKYFD
jgi:hypothetical protein